MGIFSGINEAQPAEGGVYFEPGAYVVEIVKCTGGKTRQDLPFFAADCKILQSNNPNRPVGSRVSYFVGIKRDTPALANIKKFASVAMDCDVDDVDEAGVEMIISAENPLKGKVLKASAVNTETRKGLTFTRVTWEPFRGSEDELKKLRAAV